MDTGEDDRRWKSLFIRRASTMDGALIGDLIVSRMIVFVTIALWFGIVIVLCDARLEQDSTAERSQLGSLSVNRKTSPQGARWS